MIRKGLAITIIFIVSTCIQLLSQITVTRLFGASFDLETFLAAVTIPTIMVTVIYGTLSDAFLPNFHSFKNKKNEDVEILLARIIELSAVSILFVLIYNFFSPVISALLFSGRGELFYDKVTGEMQIMMWAIPFSIVATLLGSYSFLKKKYIRFSFAQALGSVVNLVIIVTLSRSLGISALIAGFVVAIIVQVLLLFPGVKFIHIKKSLQLLSAQSANKLILFWIPLIVASFAMRSDAIIIRSFGSHLPEGYLVYLNLISKIFSLATGVMTIGVQTLLLPHLVEHIAHKNMVKVRESVKKAKLVSIALSLGTTLLLIAIAPFIIHILFVGGKFKAIDAERTIQLLPYFIIPSIGWGLFSIFFQPLIALKKQVAIGLIALSSFTLAWLTADLLSLYNPLLAISAGLVVLLGVGIIGSELVWQYYQKKY